MIEISDLSFGYTKTPFIKNMKFNVETGEIFAFLGPSGNGAWNALPAILTSALLSVLFMRRFNKRVL